MTRFSKRAEFISGFKGVFPLIVGAAPFGLIFGALGVNSGLSAQATQAMSAFVFAGSAQFIATGLIAAAAPLPFIILTTLIVNLRHLLYGASLGPHLRGLPQRWLVPLGFWLTDESYVVTISRFAQDDGSPYKHYYFLGTGVLMYANWQLCTFLGIHLGQAIPDPGRWGLDFAMVVTFIGMLVPMMQDRGVILTVGVAGITAVLANSLPNQLWLMVAAVAGITAGTIYDRIYPLKRDIARESIPQDEL